MDFTMIDGTGVYKNTSICFAQHFKAGELKIDDNYVFDPCSFGFSPENKVLGIERFKPVLLVERPQDLRGSIKDNLSFNEVLEIIMNEGPFWRESARVLSTLDGYGPDHIQWGHYPFDVGFIQPDDALICIPGVEDTSLGIVKPVQYWSLKRMVTVLSQENYDPFA